MKVKFSWDWPAIFFTIIAQYFLAIQHWITFVFFMIANIFWMIFGYKKKLWSLFALGIFYIVVHILGLYNWLHK